MTHTKMKVIVAAALILMIPILSVGASETNRGEYDVTSSRVTLTGTTTLEGDDSSDFRCEIDEYVGNGDGSVDSNEVDDTEDLIESDLDSAHTMNSVQGTISSVMVVITGALGDCASTDTVTMMAEGVVSFDLEGDSSTVSTLKFYADEEMDSNMFVEYRFSGYEIISASGLSSINIGSDSVQGFRIPGETMIIEFQEEEDPLPGFLMTSVVVTISLAAVFYTRRE